MIVDPEHELAEQEVDARLIEKMQAQADRLWLIVHEIAQLTIDEYERGQRGGV